MFEFLERVLMIYGAILMIIDIIKLVKYIIRRCKGR
uniref:DVL family n=1 Tax=Caudovirales sp. ctIbU14 TaxID=2825761 RepID=A0A8S5NS21_9CAUD|nr:MAG TPA: DVL family [Caudovirales sp. ctIbU14]